jgi:hypothetical protein
MADTTLYVTNVPGSFPSGYCWPSNPQTFANDLVNGMASYITGQFSPFVMGSTTPGAEYNSYPWIKTDVSNNLVGIYTYGSYGWTRPHCVPQSGSERRLWVGIEADLQTYDGGEAATVDISHGPFWEVDHDFDAMFPVGPGTFAGGSTVAVGQTGGEDLHVLTIPEMPEHSHDMVWDKQDVAGGTQPNGVYNGSDNGAVVDDITRPTEVTGDGDGHNNLPPYRGAYVIKRTARLYYRG